MQNEPNIVTHEEWLEARKAHLIQEKEFTRLRDQLSQQRRKLPWVKVDKLYLFDTADGLQTLSELFNGRSQLIVQHFMFDPDWEAGCKSCSFWADSYNGTIVHLNQRDISMIVASRAPLKKLQSYKQRMGWHFKWVSSLNNDFNYDYQVSHSAEQANNNELYYNYQKLPQAGGEMPGTSVFYKNEAGEIFHTYSTYARGLDMLNTAYQFMDIAPKGRDETKLPWSMAWLQRHDEYNTIQD